MTTKSTFNSTEYSKEFVGMFFEQIFGEDINTIAERLDSLKGILEQNIITAEEDYIKLEQARLQKSALKERNILTLNNLDNLKPIEIAECLGLDMVLVNKVLLEAVMAQKSRNL